jgi:adenine-specific DNA-methyltransferase
MDDSPIEGTDDDLETFGPSSPSADSINGEAFVDRMRRLLVADGVRFPDNKVAKIARLDPLDDAYLHAEGDWTAGNGKQRRVAVSFGPPHGSISAVQVEEALHAASRRGFDDVIFAGFSFDGAAQAVIQDDPNPRVRAHLAHIRPDVQMTGLLKETPNAQLFTVFGTPRTRLNRHDDGALTITMEGVDIYNPVENTIVPTRADKVAAWFLDTDYDGRTFCITQAFFPDKSAWNKLARALKGYLDEDRFAALSGTTSLPFAPGVHKRCAVKVIDPRGNEVIRVHRLDDGQKAAKKSR